MTPRNWRGERSTKEQRQEIERRATDMRLTWPEVIQLAHKVSGRTVTDTGQLTKGEASDLIDELGEGIE